MNLRIGNIWSEKDKFDVLCFTANSILKPPDFRLVMGAGFAKQILDNYKGIDYYLGRKLSLLHKQVYGLMICDTFFPVTICAFQTKIDFSDPSRLDVIGYSTIELLRYINKYKPKRIDLNYPGIGLGGLDEKLVYEVIKYLPNQVNVWKNS